MAKQSKNPQTEVQTIVINNFSGRLTRIPNGDLNSGFARFESSHGYDPFTKPGQLTWLAKPQSVVGVNHLMMGGLNAPRVISTNDGTTNVYVIGIKNATTGMLYKIATGVGTGGSRIDSVIGQQSVHGNYEWGGDLAFFGVDNKLYFSGSGAIGVAGSVIGLNNVLLNGFSSLISKNTELAGDWHPLEEFAGKLIFGNGPSIGAIDATGTIISSIFTVNTFYGNQYSQLNPPLPSDQVVHDLDVTPDNNYLQISASNTYNERIATPPLDRVYTAPGKGAVYGWNGVDNGVTTANNIPAGTATALQTYLQQHVLFMNDFLGAAVSDGVQKLVTLSNSKAPLPNATDTTGNFVVWMAPESGSDNSSRRGALYYFGSLDEQNPPGLFRLLKYQSSTVGEIVYQIPYQAIVSNKYVSVNNGLNDNLVTSFGKHYFSAFVVSSIAGITSASTAGAAQFMRFEIGGTDDSLPQLGEYQTQCQLFPKRIEIKQIRCYVQPTESGNSFSLDIVDPENNNVQSFTYTYSLGTEDITLLEGTLERINFNPTSSEGIFGFSIRITNEGTDNMVFRKIEVDYVEQGK